MAKKITLFIIALLIFIWMMGCAGKPQPEASPTPSPTPTATAGEEEKDQELGEDDPGKQEENPPLEAGDQPTTGEGLKDGSYEGESDTDERGSYGIVKLTIEGGKIKDVEYTEINGKDNKPKSRENGYDYEPALEAMESLPKALEEKQDVDKADVVSKATGTTNKFKTAAKNALAKGK
ncbi:MAG: FMN-binding protein [Clostridia bacterium]|jgi:major membrane immunogen (membrane-anchored lipoprotein)